MDGIPPVVKQGISVLFLVNSVVLYLACYWAQWSVVVHVCKVVMKSDWRPDLAKNTTIQQMWILRETSHIPGKSVLLHHCIKSEDRPNLAILQFGKKIAKIFCQNLPLSSLMKAVCSGEVESILCPLIRLHENPIEIQWIDNIWM